MRTGNKRVAEAACGQSLCVRSGIGGFELWPEVIGIQIGITCEGTGGIHCPNAIQPVGKCRAKARDEAIEFSDKPQVPGYQGIEA